MPAPNLSLLDSCNYFYELASTRRSIRRYTATPISREEIEALLNVATCAPSAHNRQPWRFLVLEQLEHKQSLARAMGEQLRQDRARDGDPAGRIEEDVARSYARLTGAPVLIVICISMAEMDVYSDEKRSGAERIMTIHSAAMAAQNLLLAARANGLGACWMCAPLFCPDTVRAALRLPSDWEPQAIVTLGHPAEEGKPYRRRPLAEVVRFHRDTP